MSCIPEASAANWFNGIHAGVRLAVAILWSVTVALLHQPRSLGASLLIAVLLMIAIQLNSAFIWRRFILINSFSVFILILVPLLTPGEALLSFGPVVVSSPGFLLAIKIVLRLNIIIFLVTALVGTLSPVRLGHALLGFKLPITLVHLFLFAIRYAGLIRSEFNRIFQSMQLRGFTPRFNMLTFRAYANAMAMVLVSSYDRGERIQRAMSLRGFDGSLHISSNESLEQKDWSFFTISVSIVILIIVLELPWQIW